MRLLLLLVRISVVSRRSLAAIVAYAIVLGILYATPGPLAEVFVPTSAALVVITAWLVVSGLSLDPAGCTCSPRQPAVRCVCTCCARRALR